MNGSDASNVITIAGDPAGTETLRLALHEAGLKVVVAGSAGEAMNIEGASREAGGVRETPHPLIRIAPRPGGAAGVALQAGDIEILLPEHARAAVLADAAQALARWSGRAGIPAGGNAVARHPAALGEDAAGDSGPRAEASLASLCHDLRTPLSVMIGWLHLLRSGKLNDAGAKRAVDKLQASLEQQIQLLDRMLDAQGGRK